MWLGIGRLSVSLCLATEFQQLGDGRLLALCKCWAHTAIMAHFINDVELFMRTYGLCTNGLD